MAMAKNNVRHLVKVNSADKPYPLVEALHRLGDILFKSAAGHNTANSSQT